MLKQWEKIYAGLIGNITRVSIIDTSFLVHKIDGFTEPKSDHLGQCIDDCVVIVRSLITADKSTFCNVRYSLSSA